MWSTFVNKFKFKNTILDKKEGVVSFENYINLTGLPLIVFEQNGIKYKFIFDTGCEISHLHIDSKIDKGILENATARSVAVNGDITICQYAGAILYQGDKEFKHVFRASDMSKLIANIKKSTGLTIEGLIGSDFMKKYNYCIDYKHLIIYRLK